MDKRVIEIGGVKLEVDLRSATNVEHYHVGDNVKVLIKNYQSWDCYPGVIVSFDNFKNLPSITVAYVSEGYSNADMFKTVVINEKSDEVEMVPLNNDLELLVDKDAVLSKIDDKIIKNEAELTTLRYHRQYFLTRFSKLFKADEIA